MNEVTGQSQATLKSKSPMQSIDRLTFVFNHPSQPTFFTPLLLLLQASQRHRFSWSRFRRRFCWHFELIGKAMPWRTVQHYVYLNQHRNQQHSLASYCTGVHR